MKFLVVLVCLLINHYWRKDRTLRGDRWISSFQIWLRGGLMRFPSSSARLPIIYPLVLMLLPVGILILLLWAAEGFLLGFVSLALHVLVLLLAFDRLNLVQLTEDYLARWRAGDYEGAYLYLQEQAPGRIEGSFADYSGLHRKFWNLLLASHFERLFVVVFWYVILGPAAVLFYVIARLYCVSEGLVGPIHWERGSRRGEESAVLLSRLVFLIEWAPARLLAVTFSLAGDFVAASSRVREQFLRMTPSLEVVRACALGALGSVSIKMQAAFESTPTLEKTTLEGEEGYPEWAARNVEELMGLLQRSQIIWVCCLALASLYGFGI